MVEAAGMKKAMANGYGSMAVAGEDGAPQPIRAARPGSEAPGLDPRAPDHRTGSKDAELRSPLPPIRPGRPPWSYGGMGGGIF